MKEIPGYEGLYSADESGLIYSHKTKRFLSAGNPGSRWGYVYVCLCKDGKSKMYPVHRLIAKAFILNPENLPIVNHKDGNKANNHVDNLEWCTQKENVHRCIASGQFSKMKQK